MGAFSVDPSETSILADASFFQIKARLDLKVKAIFGELQTALSAATDLYKERIPADVWPGSNRFYRGENHQGYPWRALDHLSNIQRGDVFTLRALLLYGCHVSLHLMLAGKYLQPYTTRLSAATPALSAIGFELSRQGSLWDWNHDAGSHQPLPADWSATGDFVKISLHLPPDQFGRFPGQALKAWETLLPVLFPAS